MGRRKTVKPAESSAGMRKSAGESETEAIIKDPAITKMLESADNQYKDGKAIPFSKLMRDLGFEEDEL
jgi:hypothetical protein